MQESESSAVYSISQSEDKKELHVQFDNLPELEESTLSLKNTSMHNIKAIIPLEEGTTSTENLAIKSYPGSEIKEEDVNYFNPEEDTSSGLANLMNSPNA